MRIMTYRSLGFLLFVSVFFTSCVKYNTFVNYHKVPDLSLFPQEINNFSPLTIEPHDILRINISSPDADAISPFILTAGGENGLSVRTESEYLVNSKGNIDLPTLGSIAVNGLTIEEIKANIESELRPYFDSAPIVSVSLANFKVSINGEVASPSTVGVPSGKLTIIEAITSAGDFTDYALRDSVLVIREKNNIREFGYINFSSTDLFDSPYFYLRQNDVIYVRPNEYKVSSVRDAYSRYVPWISASVSIIALAITLSR